MYVLGMHPEDLKAAIRKRYRSLAEFERRNGLAKQSVSEVLRGRSSRVTVNAIERALAEPLEISDLKSSIYPDIVPSVAIAQSPMSIDG